MECRVEATGVMTEAEWSTCSDADEMLTFLRGKASQRHLQFFAACCARRTFPLLLENRTDPECAASAHRGLALVERFLEGRVTREDVGETDFGVYDRSADYAVWAVSSAMEAC